MPRIDVGSNMINWACDRAKTTPEDLVGRFPKIHEWITGEVWPTLKQLENFARAVHVPVGYMFLSTPPHEPLPIPDFRTVKGQQVQRASPNLLDTIHVCQERQAWFKEYAWQSKQAECFFVGSANIKNDAEEIANKIRDAIGFSLDVRRNYRTWEDALRYFVGQVEKAGILVMISGIVYSNTRRKLDPEEFRGFALSDKLAPLIFINGSDSKSAQMFTLAHELAHIWLDSTALSNMSAASSAGYREEEIWCNAVAAELLVPLADLRGSLINTVPLDDMIDRLTRQFKVSKLVILRRLLDADYLTRKAFDTAWQQEIEQLQNIMNNRTGGGNFYHSTMARTSKKFTHALVVSTLEGQTLYRDAFRMLGIKKNESFHNLGKAVGVLT